MLKDHTPTTQALLGTLFTWALTAAGAALVIVIRGKQVSTVAVCSSRAVVAAVVVVIVRGESPPHVILSRRPCDNKRSRHGSLTNLTSFPCREYDTPLSDQHFKHAFYTVLR